MTASSFPSIHPIAAHIFFLVFPSLLSSLPPYNRVPDSNTGWRVWLYSVWQRIRVHVYALAFITPEKLNIQALGTSADHRVWMNEWHSYVFEIIRVIKQKKMGGACGTYGIHERCVHGFGWETWGKRHHLEDPGVDGRIILKLTFKKRNVDAWDWIGLAQDRNRRWSHVNAVMNLRVT